MTEKSNKLLKLNKYSFVVDLRLMCSICKFWIVFSKFKYVNFFKFIKIIYFFTKTDIKDSFKKIFDVEIKSINTCILSRKAHRLGKFKGFKNYYKKALITLLWIKI